MKQETVLLGSVATLFLSAVAQANTCFVTAGDDVGFGAALGAGCTVIVINQPCCGGYSPFTVPRTLTNMHSTLKIMAAPGEVAVWDVPFGDVFTLAPGARDVVLENLVITSNLPIAFGAGVHVYNDASVKIINCQIAHKWDGVLIDSSGTGGPPMAEIEGSRILNSFYGVHTVGNGGGGATVERTQVRNNDWGIWMEGMRARIKVWHTMIDNNRSYGVFVGSTNDATLNNNDVSFNGYDGIFYAQGAKGSLSFNTVAYNTAVGIDNVAGAAVIHSPGNNTVHGNGVDVFGIFAFSNQIG